MRTHVVHEMFEEQARRTPAATAVRHGPDELSYGELNRAANQLARWLRGHGVRPGDRVGLRVPRSADCLVTMLAILKAGAAYVPLDDGFPPAQLARMAAECGVAVIVAVPGSVPGEAPGTTTVYPSAERALIDGLDDTDLGLPVCPGDTFYVPFTSGSTGRPKGSDVPHRAVPGFYLGEDYAGWGPGAVTLMHSSLSWDGHLIEVFPALTSGATVVVAPVEVRDPVELARLARAAGVTTLWLSAQAFNTVVDVEPGLLGGLTWLMTGGEALSVAHVERAMAALPALRLVNGYGPSECTAFTCVHSLTRADLNGEAGIPIGRPVGDRRLYVLDDDGAEVAFGEVGELYVGGQAVAHGYVGRPALTAVKFVPDPFAAEPGAVMYRTGDLVRQRSDGLYEFHGRRDQQIKLRGFRIELTEVEAVLREHPQIADAAAALDTTGPAPRLVAYVVTVPAGAPVPDTLDAHARERLHAAMVPALYLPLARLPIGRTGKLDRAALPAPGAAGTARTVDDPPRTPTERLVAELWGEVLGGTAFARTDSFFALGGDSLLATRVVARVRARAGAALTVHDLYDAPELARLAERLDRLRGQPGRAAVPPPIRRAAGRPRATAIVEASNDSRR